MIKKEKEHISRLVDKRRELAARVAGLDLEIAIALGDEAAARRAQREMYAQIEARKAAMQVAEEEQETLNA